MIFFLLFLVFAAILGLIAIGFILLWNCDFDADLRSPPFPPAINPRKPHKVRRK